MPTRLPVPDHRSRTGATPGVGRNARPLPHDGSDPAEPSRHAPRAEPLVPQRGRGAVSNPQNRFESLARMSEDDGWFGDDGDAPALKTVVRIEPVRSIVSRNRSPDVPFEQSINPYRGCEHGCIYCFARPNHGYIGLSPGIDFETRLFAKADAAARLREELSAPSYQCSPIALGTATDPYQPIEREHGITRALLQVLADTRHPVLIVTKSSLIERDIDLLARLARDRLVMVHLSVTTLDAALARAWEPRATAPWRRLETVRRLSEAGIPVGVLIAPVAPFINDHDLEHILEAARASGATDARYTVLRLPWELKQLFSDWLHAYFPDRAQRVLARLAELRGGNRLNDPRFFTRMKGEGAWAEIIRMRFDIAARKHGFARDRLVLDLRTDLFSAPRADTAQLGLF